MMRTDDEADDEERVPGTHNRSPPAAQHVTRVDDDNCVPYLSMLDSLHTNKLKRGSKPCLAPSERVYELCTAVSTLLGWELRKVYGLPIEYRPCV